MDHDKKDAEQQLKKFVNVPKTKSVVINEDQFHFLCNADSEIRKLKKENEDLLDTHKQNSHTIKGQGVQIMDLIEEIDRLKGEYRVRYKFKHSNPKYKRYATKRGMERFLVLFSDEPWKAYTDKNPEDYFCCDGHNCGCDGITVREDAMVHRSGMGELEYLHAEQHECTPWHPLNPELLEGGE